MPSTCPKEGGKASCLICGLWKAKNCVRIYKGPNKQYSRYSRLYCANLKRFRGVASESLPHKNEDDVRRSDRQTLISRVTASKARIDDSTARNKIPFVLGPSFKLCLHYVSMYNKYYARAPRLSKSSWAAN